MDGRIINFEELNAEVERENLELEKLNKEKGIIVHHEDNEYNEKVLRDHNVPETYWT